MRNFAQLALLGAALTMGLGAQELTLDQIIEKNLAAIGGADAVKAVDTLTLKAKMVLQGGMLEAPLTIKVKRPGMIWSAISVQGKDVISAWDGRQGWTLNPMTGSNEAQKIDEKMARQLLESADIEATIGALNAYRNKGASLELVGKEDVEGAPAYKIRINRQDSEPRTLFLSASTFLPVKAVAKTTQMGQELEVESYPSDYRKVGGVLMAYMNDSRVSGKSMMKMSIDSAEVNLPIDDAVFRFPAPAKPAEKK